MATNTNLNISPYFDDYDESKNYHRILFKPAVAVQARELTQLQTILQNQIERFGDNVLQEGTIVRGGNFVEEDNLAYVKINDIARNTNGNEVASDINQYVNLKAVGQTNGLEAMIIATEFGLESQTPNLSTLFVKYTKYAIVNEENVKSFVPGEAIQLYIQDANEDYTIPYHVVNVASLSVDNNPVGYGYGVRCGDGIIYQKGFFVGFTDHLTIVSKYNNKPDGVVVGFETDELLIDANADSSLLDNANGFLNENAPGADRLQLIPRLVVKTVEEAEEDDRFFAIQEYAEGKVVRRNLTTQYNVIEREMERRTYEESGSYVVDRFNVAVKEDKNNLGKLDVVVDSGLAYVDGHRVELLNSIKIDLPEASTYSSVSQQDVRANYGSYIEVDNYSGIFDATSMESVDLKEDGNTIGTARVRAVTKQSDGNYRVYLASIAMANTTSTFAKINNIESASGGTANTIPVAGETKLVDSSFNSMVYGLGKGFVKTVHAAETDYVYRTNNNIQISSNTITLTTTSPDVFPYTPGNALNSDEIRDFILVANSSVGGVNSGEDLEVTNASIDSTGRQVTVNLVKNPGANLWVNATYNVKKKQTSIGTKSLRTVYVKINTSSHPNGTDGKYSLGLPDGYDLVGVWRVPSSEDWSTIEDLAENDSNSNNVTNYFKLNKNQNDEYYGLSYVSLARSLTIDAGDKIIIKARVFEKTSGIGHFFTVDSYPIDDDSLDLPDDKIRTEDIPIYISDRGSRYDLRDSVDLRPYVDPTSVYATIVSNANTNPSESTSFTNAIIPAPNRSIELSYDYYLPRRDLVVIDKKGNFDLIQGVPAEDPTYPVAPSKSMTIAHIEVPAFPTLSSSKAQSKGRINYGVGLSSNQTKRYTMKDIGSIDKRIKNIEYYTALSALEMSAKDMSITDANGNDRFKNGIFVDNFNDLYNADVNGGEFAAAIDPETKTITPKIRQYNLKMKYDSGTNTENHGKFVTLNSRDKKIDSVHQKYATNVKNCTTSFYSYNGKMQLFPAYDSGPDTVKAPDMTFDIDLATPFMEFTEALSEFVPLSRTDVSRVVGDWDGGHLNFSHGINQIFGIGRRTITTTTTTTELQTSFAEPIVLEVGDFVRDVNFSPFIRTKDIKVSVVGLRPNTRFYPFFDGTDVTLNVAPGEYRTDSTVEGNIEKKGDWGEKLVSNSNGELYAVFRIPADTYHVGDRRFELIDVNNLADKDASTSYASSVYNAYNFSSTQSTMTSITRPPAFDNVVTGVDVAVTRQRGCDPLAQTFIIDGSVSDDTDVFVSKIDLYFAKKSKNNQGVGIQIREVDNGYPTGKEVPFTSVHLSASEVNAPSNSIAEGATEKTTVEFEGPVALKVDTEYAIIIAPDGNDPDYLVWVARTGEQDVDTGKQIVQDTNSGMLFTSTNARTWIPYQNEDLKFTLYQAEFTQKQGSVDLVPDNPEFFTIRNVNGNFQKGERVFYKNNSNNQGTVSSQEGSRTLNGNGTNFNNAYIEGEAIGLITTNGDYIVRVIDKIDSNTSLRVNEPILDTLTGMNHFSTVIGMLNYINIDEPPRMILEKSTAKSSLKFNTNTIIKGEDSGSEAEIDSIDDLPISWIQPAIYRSNFSKTRTNLKLSQGWNGSQTVTKDLSFNDTNHLTGAPHYVRSRSNDTSNSGLRLTIDMENKSIGTAKTSPVIDHDISSVMLAEYMVNGDDGTVNSSEMTELGTAKAKYVSKTINLANGMDAEGISVILSQYKPIGTDIRVFVKFKSDTDTRSFDSVEWTKLEVKENMDVFSSSVNRFDYKEVEYVLGTTSKSANEGAWDNNGEINYIAELNGVDVLFEDYKSYAIKIVLLSDQHNLVPRIKDIRAISVT